MNFVPAGYLFTAPMLVSGSGIGSLLSFTMWLLRQNSRPSAVINMLAATLRLRMFGRRLSRMLAPFISSSASGTGSHTRSIIGMHGYLLRFGSMTNRSSASTLCQMEPLFSSIYQKSVTQTMSSGRYFLSNSRSGQRCFACRYSRSYLWKAHIGINSPRCTPISFGSTGRKRIGGEYSFCIDGSTSYTHCTFSATRPRTTACHFSASNGSTSLNFFCCCHRVLRNFSLASAAR